MITGANRWEDGGQGRALMRKGKIKGAENSLPAQLMRPSRSATSHIITIFEIELYRTLLDGDRQYSCAYFTDPATAWSRRNRTRRRILLRSST
jgi:cyclopropane-fatty-acyl-phospholipid synthase